MTIGKRDVTFKSGDTFAAGWFFLPEHATSEARVPTVAMAHGLGAVKEMYLEPFARRFAEAALRRWCSTIAPSAPVAVSRACGCFLVTRSRTTAVP